MSRGAWIMLIGGVSLLVGIALFAFGFAGIFPNLVPTTTSLTPGEFLNRTTSVQAGSFVNYVVGISSFAVGDNLTVVVQPLPPGGSQEPATVNTADPAIVTIFAPEARNYTLVIQNTGGRTVDVFVTITELTATSVGLITAGVLVGIGGLVVLIVGFILWYLDRRRGPQTMPGMPPPPT